ncbi:beta family protein [Pectobacterium odoriferum]|uniref:beta family protein n=1 Tax=Pectobacterium odoriferum TaxID=78398 RepID=UPI000CD17F1E|nr:hypothetical protein [Pectobacterium odoriferum]POD97064.1 hypothetical protein BVY06_07060 [Pectobacterium odoriferum]
MRNYIPFLKLKGSELSALKAMHKTHPNFEPFPFFDFPRKKPKKSRKKDAPQSKSKADLFSDDLKRLHRKFELNIKYIKEFYLDNFDIEDGILHNGQYNYYSIIKTFGPLGMVPVVGLDRHADHIVSIKAGLNGNLLSSNRVAIRLTQDDFESFSLCKKDLIELLNEIYFDFEKIDLILDCRFCKEKSSSIIYPLLINFLVSLSKEPYKFSRVIVTGSSVPASISEVILPRTERAIFREELLIYNGVANQNGGDIKFDLYFGDYTCVSPEYSDIELFDEDMDNVTTAKLIYPYDDELLLIRGGRFKTDRGQIKDLANKLIIRTRIYRGDKYSTGDKYIYEKANGIGRPATAASIVPHLVNLHLIYMFNK